MKAQLGRHSDTIYALMRIVVGFLFACHGAQKLMMIMAGTETPMPAAMLWAAMLIELVGGILVMIGLFTSWAAFVSSGTMAVAYWYAHAPQDFFPVNNGGDAAILYCFVFLYFVFSGPGAWSLDGRRGAA